jgi:hypothetical protein
MTIGEHRTGALWAVLAAAILGGVAWIRLRPGPDLEQGLVLTLADRYLLDDRLHPLIYDCNYGRTFDDQLADLVPVLVSKLENGTRDPLRQAKMELGRIGAPAMGELTRMFDRLFDDRWKTGVLENVIAACSMMKDGSGLPVLRRALTHQQGSVRLGALPGLSAYGDSSDYDLVAAWLPIAEGPVAMAEYASTMEQLDQARFFSDLADWMTVGQFPKLWRYVVLSVTKCEDEQLAARFKGLAALRDEEFIPFLMAPAAKLGDADAMQELQSRLRHERPEVRQLAVDALAAIGRVQDVASMVKDEHAGVRVKVVEALLTDKSEEASAWLREATKDANAKIRETALIELVARGDELAVAEALGLLEGNVLERELAVRALRLSWDANPGSAEKAYGRLMDMWQREQGESSGRIGVLLALAHVPLVEASTFLLDFGSQFEGEVKGRRAHRWACGQVWNTGEVGRKLLRDTLKTETDPFRRLDLIEFIWQDHSPAARECLLGVLLNTEFDPHERLYAADRLTRIGPAEVVAPAIKRVYLDSTDAMLRPALQCMLWTWYGQHYF